MVEVKLELGAQQAATGTVLVRGARSIRLVRGFQFRGCLGLDLIFVLFKLTGLALDPQGRG